jgi:hypothetical protein
MLKVFPQIEFEAELTGFSELPHLELAGEIGCWNWNIYQKK